jgi:multidrug resistance efflux pump
MTRIFASGLFLSALLSGCSGDSKPTPQVLGMSPDRIAASGRIEPQDRERVVIPETTGRIVRILVEEGDHVKTGQLLAVIENSELSARVTQANAARALRQAELERMRAGPRAQEKVRARAGLARAEAQHELAVSELRRREQMVAQKQNLISAQELAQLQAQARISAADLQHSRAELRLLEEGNRAEDIAQAEAALAVADAELLAAEAALARSDVRSPIDGVVLKRMLNVGETVTVLAPQPFAYLGDTRQRVVRAEVSELDIAGLREDARAWVRSDAFPNQEFSGQVQRISGRMGPRQALSDDPAEYRDVKVIEATIALDDAPALPVGLRVDVFIERAQSK